MKSALTALIVTIVVFSCRSKIENKHLVLLKGDWRLNVGDYEKGDWSRVFSFEDSVCSLHYSNKFRKYKIEEDTIIIPTESKEFIPYEDTIKFCILFLNKDSLLLKMLAGSKNTGGTIRLERIQKKNSLVPEEIYFSSTNCYGHCPAMKLKIDNEGRYYFWGGDYSKIEGLYSGVLDKKKYQILINKIQTLPLDSILPRYDFNIEHNPKYGVLINTKGKQFISCLYGSNEAPTELYILFNYLMNLHSYFDTKKDTRLKEKYFETNPEFQKIREEFRYLGLGPYKDAIENFEIYSKQFKKTLRRLKGQKYKDAIYRYKLEEQSIEYLKLSFPSDSTKEH